MAAGGAAARGSETPTASACRSSLRAGGGCDHNACCYLPRSSRVTYKSLGVCAAAAAAAAVGPRSAVTSVRLGSCSVVVEEETDPEAESSRLKIVISAKR